MPHAPSSGVAARLLRELVAPADAAFLGVAQRPFAERHQLAQQPRHRGRARATTTLLVNGCGRSGTHALTALLRRSGVSALHEGHGREATVGWPYAGRLDGSWFEYWPMSNQPHGSDTHDPIFKVHRHPLTAVRSIAIGLTSSGACRNPSERRWDARAWRCATRFVPLPVPQPAIEAQQTCALGWTARVRLALHYWVKWNLLADRWATHTFAVETLTSTDIMARWCAYCERAGTCRCPPAATSLAAQSPAVSMNVTTARQRDRVRARRGHGKRKGAPLTWTALSLVDANMTRVAIQLALDYGYELEPNVTTQRSVRPGTIEPAPSI